jgi:glyceraldehyde 3-phosphate dehydrogenase
LEDPVASKNIDIAVINIGPGKINAVAHMVKYDSLMGIYPGKVNAHGDQLMIDNHTIKVIAALDPLEIDWRTHQIDWVVESSGKFTKREGAEKHLKAGARYVLITAPAKDEDISIVPGINDALFDPKKHKLVSLGSCTTNAYAPMLKVLNDAFVLESSLMTTVHAYTNSQVLLDREGADLRRSRAAAINIIPTSTGAMQVINKVMPELSQCVEGLALRVPVAKVSLIDLTFLSQKEVTTDAINRAFVQASTTTLKGVVDLTMEPLVSSDFSGNNHSVIIDGSLTVTCGARLGKAFGWYDNEWGYSSRLKDFLVNVSKASS